MSATFGRPPPVAYLTQIGAQCAIIPAGTLLWRIYNTGGPHPTRWNTFRAWGPTDSRFDHHTLPKRIQERAIIYAAENGPTCFAERFQAIRRINRTLDHPWLVAFRTATNLTLLDLCGNWPTRAGGSQEINTGRHTTSRAWSRAIYATYVHVEGLLYPSKMLGGTRSLALYERARHVIPPAPLFHEPLLSLKPAMLRALTDAASQTGYEII
jgi:hypothetical protein